MSLAAEQLRSSADVSQTKASTATGKGRHVVQEPHRGERVGTIESGHAAEAVQVACTSGQPALQVLGHVGHRWKALGDSSPFRTKAMKC
jgi:hypothetical protein